MATLRIIASKSDLMVIDITFNGKRYKFNMYDELQVKEGRLNSDIKTHASSYAFLTQLLVHLETQVEELEEEKKYALDTAYVKYKKQTNGNRPITDDLAKALSNKSKLHQKALGKLITARHNKNLILRAVRSYEAKKDLLQSLSANIRNEK